MTEPPTLPTRTGHAEWGDNRAFGYSVARDLLGSESFLGLTALAIAGRRFTAEECALLDDMAVAMTVADPRIWPLKLIRVISSYAPDLSAFAIGELCQAGAPIGPHATALAAELLVELRREVGEEGEQLEVLTRCVRARIDRGQGIAGVGRAFLRAADERIALLHERARLRSRSEMPYFRLFLNLQAALEKLAQPPPNAAPAFAALCLDLGLTPNQCGILAALLCSADFLGNAVEGAEQAPVLLRELPQGVVAYRGAAARSSPRAVARRRGQ